MGRIVQAIILPDAWMDRVLARIHLADEIKRIEEERRRVEQRLKRLGKAYVDGLYGDEDYKREKRFLEERAASLVIPGIDVAREAGKLLEDLPTLWQEANLSERHKLLHTTLDAVYVDTVEEKAIVALKPKPAFQALFQIATTLESSGVILYKENPPDQFPSPEDNSPCFWWRRGRGGHSLFANNCGGPVVSGLLISPWIYALDGKTGQARARDNQHLGPEAWWQKGAHRQVGARWPRTSSRL